LAMKYKATPIGTVGKWITINVKYGERTLTDWLYHP
jgi:hypothetical protein